MREPEYICAYCHNHYWHAERDALQAENERLAGELAIANSTCEHLTATCQELEEELARVKAAAREAVAANRGMDATVASLRRFNRAFAALEQAVKEDG